MHKEFFELLHSQHESVKSILGKMSGSNETRTRISLLQQLESELRPHMQAEEDLFYPILAEKKATRNLALEAIEEHHLVRIELDDMRELDASSSQWRAKAKVLLDIVSHHISEEEDEVFEKTRQEFDEETTDDIFLRFVDEEEQVKLLVNQ